MVDWKAIVDRDGPAVWRTAYRLLGNRADAEDCFQETFLAALELSRRERIEHPRAVLQRLATARAFDRLRRRYRRARDEARADWDAVAARDPRPPELAEAAELSERLREALAALPGQQAEVFCLHCLEGWSYSEIVGRIGSSTGAVGVALHRARSRLRKLLGPPVREQAK